MKQNLIGWAIALWAILPELTAMAQNAGDAPQVSTAGFMSGTLWFLAFGIAGYYFLVTRPLVMKDAEQKKFIAGLKRNDEIVTSGGIFGRVQVVAADSITIEVAPNVRIKLKPEHVLAPPAQTGGEEPKKVEVLSKK